MRRKGANRIADTEALASRGVAGVKLDDVPALKRNAHTEGKTVITLQPTFSAIRLRR